jgi:hypothetical protein
MAQGETDKKVNQPVSDTAPIDLVDEDAAIDGVDPIYAAKARVLNRAVSLHRITSKPWTPQPILCNMCDLPLTPRSKTSAWADTSGSCSS